MIRRGFLAAACAAALLAPAPGAAQSPATIRVATTPIELGAEVMYAQDQGFFKKAGLNVDVQIMDSGAAIAAAVASGALDVAQGNLVTLATAHERGLPFVVVAPAGLYSSNDSTTSLVVAKSSPIKSGKDLEGKTVAVNGLRNITQIGTSAWMEQNGGDYTKVRFIEMPFPQMGAALEAGRIDAAVIAEPELSTALAGGTRVLAQPYTAIAKEFLIGGWFTTSAWAKAHPAELKRFVAAIVDAGKWANGHRAESAKILERYTKIHVSPAMKRTIYAERLTPAEIQPLIDAAAKYKSLKGAFPASDLIASAG
ncbi:MAG TPA: ABC transporter substrate-binding protein [Candidatus Elarobacter sp.]|jgi:NitT/TauT family transport system substrate-binding protein|nr:ABC transporter substrate-binding protein [Candidatus Elarobacter sp.]